MSDSSISTPNPKILQAALRKTTEGLAGEFACPTLAAPEWSDIEWGVAPAVAAMHGVSSLLCDALRWQGPLRWRAFLIEQRTHTATRHLRIRALLEQLDAWLRDSGVAAVALKGAALYALGLYSAGERPMADVDLLIQPQDAQRVVKLIESMGYRESRTASREREFSPIDSGDPHFFGEHADNQIKIEMHERIGETLPLYDTYITGYVFPRQPHSGLNPYPSLASLMIHLLMHAAGAMASQTLRLMHLHDIALLARRMTDADWDAALACRACERGPWWAFPPLQMTTRYYPTHIPSAVISAFARDCPPRLAKIYRKRQLSDVSYSYLWVDAFPGIEWSRSLSEMLRYAAYRIKPNEEITRGRARALNAEAWAAQGAWPRLSQGRRIVRWMISRPLRSRTLHAVSVALSQAQREEIFK